MFVNGGIAHQAGGKVVTPLFKVNAADVPRGVILKRRCTVAVIEPQVVGEGIVIVDGVKVKGEVCCVSCGIEFAAESAPVFDVPVNTLVDRINRIVKFAAESSLDIAEFQIDILCRTRDFGGNTGCPVGVGKDFDIGIFLCHFSGDPVDNLQVKSGISPLLFDCLFAVGALADTVIVIVGDSEKCIFGRAAFLPVRHCLFEQGLAQLRI